MDRLTPGFGAMIKDNCIANLAIFGGDKLFSEPKSTSNLLQPDIEKFLAYSKAFIEQHHSIDDGPNVRLLEKRLAEFHHARFCLTFTSGFWAIALALRALSLAGKTEIIMPSLTYRRMPDIAAWLGLKPRFCEVEPQSLAMSAATVEPCINENTAVILGVHPIVNCCDVGELTRLARDKNIPILFDSVESVYEWTQYGKVGTFGDAECFSLHACKLLNGFGGGYLTTNDGDLASKLAAMRNNGIVNGYGVEAINGMNANINEMHAAMTLASLDDVEEQIERNRERYYAYRDYLESVPGIRLVKFDENYKAGYKNIVAELIDEWPLGRAQTIEILNAENVLARPYYYPQLHQKEMDFPYVPAVLPVTDELAEKYINLPCGHLVTKEDIVQIIRLLEFISFKADEISERFCETVAC